MLKKIKLSFKELLIFTFPLIVGQVGQMLFGIGDTFVAGRYSTEALSAIGVGSAIMAPFIMLGVATLFSVSSISSRIRGEGNCPRDEKIWGSALILCALIATTLTLCLYILAINLDLFGLHSDISKEVQTYLYWVGISLVPALFFQTAKEYLQSFEKTIFANSLVIFMNIVNLGMNWVFMFGYGPIPAMGIKGAALATVITRSVMALVLLVYTFKVAPCTLHYSKQRISELIKLGLPVGLGTLVEVLMFSTVTVLIGKMPIHISAAHNIVLNIAGLTFMVPLAINGTAGVKVSYAFGKKDFDKMESYALGCIVMAQSFMLFTATMYLLIPSQLVSLFTTDQQVVAYGSSLFLLVALFQIPDGLQVTLWGILRGMGISKLPLILTFFGHWLIAIPIGLYLTYKLNMQAKGLWAGLAIGLTIVSFALLGIYFKKLKLFKDQNQA